MSFNTYLKSKNQIKKETKKKERKKLRTYSLGQMVHLWVSGMFETAGCSCKLWTWKLTGHSHLRLKKKMKKLKIAESFSLNTEKNMKNENCRVILQHRVTVVKNTLYASNYKFTNFDCGSIFSVKYSYFTISLLFQLKS